jgi:hypothetical protein
VRQVYSYQLTHQEVAEIEAVGPDIILLAGGTDGGEATTIVHNAVMLAESSLRIPVIVAGNKSVGEQVMRSLRQLGEEARRTCLKGAPDMTADPEVQRRKDQLVKEALALIHAIRELGVGRVEDSLFDPTTLAYAVKIGLLDAPQLKNNPYVPGQVNTRAVKGAILAVGEGGNPLAEEERIRRVLARAEAAGRREDECLSP